MINVKDKVVLITGAGGGIGREHALEFGRRGAKVVVNDLGSNVRGDGVSNLASNVAAEIVQLGGAAVANNFSVADPCLLYTSPSPRDSGKSRMPSSA